MIIPSKKTNEIDARSAEGFLGPKIQGNIPSKPRYKGSQKNFGFDENIVFAKAQVEASNKMWVEAGLSSASPFVRKKVSPLVEAKSLFLQRVKALPGHTQIVAHGDDIADQEYTVLVKEGDVDTEMAIYDIKAEVLRTFPDTYFKTAIREYM